MTNNKMKKDKQTNKKINNKQYEINKHNNN